MPAGPPAAARSVLRRPGTLVQDLPLVQATVRADFEKSGPDAAQGAPDPIAIVEGMATGPPASETQFAGEAPGPLGVSALVGS